MTEKTEKKNNENNISEKVSVDDQSWGIDMYPERRGAQVKSSWFKTMIGAGGRESLDNVRCENNVYYCIKNSK